MLDKVIELAERFDVFDRVKKLLLAQPDKANQKLAEVLDELTKTVGALEAEMVRYLNLTRRKHHTRSRRAFGDGRRAVDDSHKRD
jgi:hypothetical protein